MFLISDSTPTRPTYAAHYPDSPGLSLSIILLCYLVDFITPRSKTASGIQFY